RHQHEHQLERYYLEPFLPHPVEYSFPTRRSSDLAIDRLRGGARTRNELQLEAVEPTAEMPDVWQAVASDLERKQIQEGFRELPEDRKSTRLNSSHLVTPYAVFCWKKKTSWLGS